ncbi:MAG TPA: hypothetical protein VFJ43_07210 [Bacteroidia bacterium]|nr:hypothetical protein [Bacteroidia bacterium]
MRRLLLLFSGFFLIGVLHAQVETQTVNVNSNVYDETKLLYRNEASAGLTITTNGFGLSYRRGYHVTNARKRVFEIEGVSYRHPKAVKITNEYYDHPKGYYYGKLNSLFIVRPGFGYQNVIFTKPEHNGIEIRWIAFGGVSLGFAKPVYLEILELTPIQGQRVVVTERYDPNVHFIDNIYGRAPFMKGIGQTKIHPGAYAKLGINFEYGALDNDIKSIETGVTIDAYPKAIPLMANEHNHPVLISLYLNFSYGGKWF